MQTVKKLQTGSKSQCRIRFRMGVIPISQFVSGFGDALRNNYRWQ